MRAQHDIPVRASTRVKLVVLLLGNHPRAALYITKFGVVLLGLLPVVFLKCSA